MGRKAKYSKEVKIKACKDYEKGRISLQEIADTPYRHKIKYSYRRKY